MDRRKKYKTPEIIVTKFDIDEKLMDGGFSFETTHPNENPGDIVTKEWESPTDVDGGDLPF